MSEQRAINERAWAGVGKTIIGHYERHPLRAGEAAIFARHAGAFTGDVLELGVGTGRLTGRLIDRAHSVTGLDIAPAMVEHCRNAFPTGAFVLGDMCDLSDFGDASFDAVLAGYAVIDVLAPAERAAALREWHRVLRGGGVLVFSAHNVDHAQRRASPWRVASRDPRTLARNLKWLPLRLRNRRRLGPLEVEAGDWAVRNDLPFDFGLLHHYIRRDEQETQLAAAGYELLEVLDLEGAVVGPGERAPGSSELHYVARRKT